MMIQILVTKLILMALVIGFGILVAGMVRSNQQAAFEFITHNFDKLLVVFLILVIAGWLNALIFWKADAGAIDKAWQVLFTILGLLTGLITGQRILPRKTDDGTGAGTPTALASTSTPKKEGE